MHYTSTALCPHLFPSELHCFDLIVWVLWYIEKILKMVMALKDASAVSCAQESEENEHFLTLFCEL